LFLDKNSLMSSMKAKVSKTLTAAAPSSVIESSEIFETESHNK